MEKQNQTEKPYQCFHCGNEGIMSIYGSYSQDSRQYDPDDFQWSSEQKMLICNVCHKVTLLDVYSDESMVKFSRGECEYLREEKILFPINTIEKGTLPEEIAEAYTSALKVQNIDINGCMMLLRRTLELILRDQGAVKGTLEKEIDDLAKKEILPETLKNISNFTRTIGNSAAHDVETSVNDHVVSTLLEFIEYLINYIYIIPEKMEQLKTAISKEPEDEDS